MKKIETSLKDFINRSRAYTCLREALNEIIVNQFYAPESKNINMYFKENLK